MRGGYPASNLTPTGRWCAQTIAADTSGNFVEIGRPAYVEIGATDSDGGHVTVTDLGYWGANEFDAGDTGGADPIEPDPKTCPCDTVAAGPADDFFIEIFCILLVLSAGRRLLRDSV